METSSPRPPRPSSNPGLSLDARLGVDTRLWAKVLFTVLYALIWALGAAGNALSVHVVLKARAGRAGRLRHHVLSLALAGLLLLLVGVPVELYSFVWFHYPWVFGDLGCRGYYFVQESTSQLPARGPQLQQKSQRIAAQTWLCSSLLRPGVAVTMNHISTMPGSRVPSLVTPLALPPQVNVLVSFVLPLALTAFLNGVTVSHLLALCSQVPSTSTPGSSTPSRLELLSEEGLLSFIVWKKTFIQGGQVSLVRHKDVRRIRSLQRSVQVLRAIVVMYVICWLPYHARRLMYCYVPDDAWTDPLYNFYHYFYMVTNTLFYVSSAVTPLLYNAVSSSFRKLFLEAVSSLCGEHHPMKRPTLMDTASGFGDPPETRT
uniref:Neurotensin receptor 2 n=1 Tax=Gorilla gorilla gorilla TaxID=9595 RepID=G3RR42_GORGO